MDGFRDRLNGRYERGAAPRGRERSMDDRFVERPDIDDGYDDRQPVDRYEYSPRMEYGSRGARRAPMQESINPDIIADVVEKSNRNQLNVLADFFDEAKADRLESERTIINAVSEQLESIKSLSEAAKTCEDNVSTEAEQVAPVVDNEALTRIERMSSQNAETLSENGEMLERSYNSLRSNTELLNDIKGSIGDIQASQDSILNQTQYLSQSISQSVAATLQSQGEYGQSSSVSTDEIINAIGDNRSLLNMIRQDIISGLQKADVPEENIEEKADVLTAELAEKYYKDLEEHIHKECVKCYRNVESKLEEQNGDSMKKLEKKVASISSVSTISFIVNLLLNIITVAILVCLVLGIFSL